MKLKALILSLMILVAVQGLLIAQTKKDKKKTDTTTAVTMPRAVTELTLPDGWSDAVLTQIAEEEEIKKPVMAIVDFSSNRELDLNVKDLGLTELLTTALFNTGKFELVERKKLEAVFKEQKLSNSDDFASSNAARLGELLGADAIITGKISTAVRDIQDKYSHYELNASITLSVLVIDSSTGKTLKTFETEGVDTAILVTDDRGNVIKGPAEFQNTTIEEGENSYSLKGINMSKQFVGAAKKSIQKLSSKIESGFPLLGYVLTADNTSLMTDIGSVRGLKRGEYLIIVRPGKEIVHPKTKKVVGYEKEVIGSAKAESVTDKDSTLSVIKLKNSANPPVPGDVVITVSMD